MMSQDKFKQIQRLKTKKGRTKEKLYIIEGARCIKSFIENGTIVKEIFLSKSFVKTNKKIIELCGKNKIAFSIISNKELKKLSETITPSGVLGICKLKIKSSLDIESKRWLYLYKVSDPGNLGSILRTAAWFNIKNVALSNDSTDPFSPKVVRSAVGAHTYLNIHRNIDYNIFFDHEYFLIGADQNGLNKIEIADYNKKLVLVLGGESKGLDNIIKNKLNKLISIKKIGYGESLNVAIAGSIMMRDITNK